jgi:tetratricopeptide (TPR) repeat protein
LNVPGLPSELYNRCRSVFLQCGEFDSDASLRAVFVTAELRPFRDGLRQAGSKGERVDACLDYLLPKRLRDGRPALPLFIEALRARYQPGDALRGELARLNEAVKSVFGPPFPEGEPDGDDSGSTNDVVKALLAEGNKLIEEGRLEEAVKLLKAARSNFPENESIKELFLKALYSKGVRAYVRDDNLYQAKYAFQEIVDLDPFYGDAARLLDEVQRRLEQLSPFARLSDQVLMRLRDPVWQGIGAVVGILACMLALLAVPPIQSLLWPAKAVTPSASTPILTPAPTLTPTSTLTPSSTPTPSATPTPTLTPTPTCSYQADTVTDTLALLIQAEGEALEKQDMTIVETIFAGDAVIHDAVTGKLWCDPLTRYTSFFAEVDSVAVERFGIQPVGPGILEDAAWFTSGNTTTLGIPPTTYTNGPGSDHWTFRKDDQGCWVITAFTFNASHIPFPPPLPARPPSNCFCQSATDEAALCCLIQAEAKAANQGDLNIVEQIFAPNATLLRGDTGESWEDPLAYFAPTYASLVFTDAVHFDMHIIRMTEQDAWLTSGSSGVYAAPGETPHLYDNENPSEHWSFAKNEGGCWVITDYEFNASHIPFP